MKNSVTLSKQSRNRPAPAADRRRYPGFSQLESGKLVLNHEPFKLRECVETTVALWAPQAHARHLELVSMVYSDVPTILSVMKHASSRFSTT